MYPTVIERRKSKKLPWRVWEKIRFDDCWVWVGHRNRDACKFCGEPHHPLGTAETPDIIEARDDGEPS